jgi:hypothetical protein
LRADVNVIDFNRLRLHKPELVHDMPAGGRRFVQRADGYEATLWPEFLFSSVESTPVRYPDVSCDLAEHRWIEGESLRWETK